MFKIPGYNKIFFIFFFALFLTGCLKDKAFENGSIQSIHSNNSISPVVSIGLTAGSTSNFYSTSFNSVNADTIINVIPVLLDAPQPASQDIHVTLTMDTTLVLNYDTANGTNYNIPPTGSYTIVNPGNIVTIPKGSSVGYLQIKLNPSNFLGNQFAFGFRITAVSNPGVTISGNASTGIFAFGIKNKYDGIYSLRIQTTGWAAYGISDGVTANFPGNFSFITAGSNSNTWLNANTGAGQVAITASGSPTAFGATSPLFTFDPTNDQLVNVVNTTPDDGRGRVFVLNPAVSDSRYDPATKTIYAAYIMKQNGRPNQFIYDTLSYISPR